MTADGMRRHKVESDALMERIRGAAAAEHLVHGLRSGVASPECLLRVLRQIQAGNSESRLGGFCGELQRALERTA